MQRSGVKTDPGGGWGGGGGDVRQHRGFPLYLVFWKCVFWRYAGIYTLCSVMNMTKSYKEDTTLETKVLMEG